MDEDGLEAMEEFVSGPLVTWMQTLEDLLGGRSLDQLPQGEEEASKYFRKLVDGDFLHRIMQMIDSIPRDPPFPWRDDDREEERLQGLQTVLQRLQNFYRDELHQVILSPPPNLHVVVREPFTAQAVQEMKKLAQLLLGSAVQCEQREVFIGQIQSLDISAQSVLASAIKEVSQEPENVLGLQWREMDASSMQQLLWELGARVQKLSPREMRDWSNCGSCSRNRDPARGPSWRVTSPTWGFSWPNVRPTCGVSKLRLERKTEELLDQQEESRNLEQQLRKTQHENRALAGEVRQARLYQDELDALREKAVRAERLQAELTALRERIPALERCREQLKEERDFSKALLEAKAMMEEELDAAYARGQHRSQAEKENLRLQNHLNQIQEEREELSYQSEELLRENLLLKKQLRETLRNSPRESSWSEDPRWDANEFPEVPLLLDCEMKEADRLSALEKENRERRRRQLALGSKTMEAERKDANLDGLPERQPGQAEEENSDVQEHKPGVLARQKTETEEGQASKQGSETSGRETKAALARAQARLREAEQTREAESRRAASLEEELRSLRGGYTEAQEERERWQADSERLVEEIQALEREKEASKAGSRALQEAATQAEVDFNQAQQSLQKERLRGAQLAQTLRGREEELGEAQQELRSLQRSVEQHRVALAQLEAEKGALEEALGQAESGRRQVDKDNWRLKAKSQAQEAALAEQGRQLARLEAQTRQQAAELTSLQEVLQSLGELEEENANLRSQLEDKEEAAALLEQELAKEKAGPSKDNAAGLQDHPLKEPQSPEPETDSSQAKPRESCKGRPESAPAGRLEERRPTEEQLVQTQEAVLQAENAALTGRLTQLESLASSLETVLSGLTRQKTEGKEGGGKAQAQHNRTSQRPLLVRQLSDIRPRSGRSEAEVQAVRLEAEGWRRRHEQLRLDHDRLMVLHRQQGDELERTLSEQAGLKASLRGLEKEQRDLEGRHNQLLGQKTSLELQKVALQAQRERLELAERRHQDLAEKHAKLKEERERVQRALAQSERGHDDLQGELQGMQTRLTGLQLEQAKLEAENAALKEQNQQLDTALGRLSTQCELLVQLKGKQEEENRHLLLEIQLLSWENRQLLERSMEKREQFQEEQRQYQDKLGELRREKQKLVEKIMDQYRVLDPAIPRGKKSNWIAGKIRRLMRLRREQPRPMAEGAGSSNESLAGPEEHGLDSRVSSTPGSPSLLRQGSSNASLPDSPPVQFRRCRLSSRMPAAEPSGSGDEEGQDTPRQRFRQRRLGVLWGSLEGPAAPARESEPPSPLSTTREEKRGQPPGEEDQTSTCDVVMFPSHPQAMSSTSHNPAGKDAEAVKESPVS